MKDGIYPRLDKQTQDVMFLKKSSKETYPLLYFNNEAVKLRHAQKILDYQRDKTT